LSRRTGRHQGRNRPRFFRLARKKYGHPATVRWHEAGGGGSQIVRMLRAEYKTDSSAGVDVFYGGGVTPFLDLEKDGLLTRTIHPPIFSIKFPHT